MRVPVTFNEKLARGCANIKIILYRKEVINMYAYIALILSVTLLVYVTKTSKSRIPSQVLICGGILHKRYFPLVTLKYSSLFS